MSDPAFERPVLGVDELQAAYKDIVELDAKLVEVAENRETLLEDVRARIRASNIPDEAKLLALALKSNQVARLLEYLTKVDTNIRAHSGDVVGRVCHEGLPIPGTDKERIMLILTLGRLPSTASLDIDQKGDAGVAVDGAVKIHILEERIEGSFLDAAVRAALGPIWKNRRLSPTLLETDTTFVTLPRSRTSGDAFLVGEEEISSALLRDLDPNHPNEAVLRTAFDRLPAG